MVLRTPFLPSFFYRAAYIVALVVLVKEFKSLPTNNYLYYL